MDTSVNADRSQTVPALISAPGALPWMKRGHLSRV